METPPLGSLEKAEKRLYSKKEEPSGGISRHLSEHEYSIREDWGEKNDIPMVNKKTKSFWHKFFTFSVVFFLFALALSAFIFWRGSNLISSNNVDIIVNGPISVAAGDETSFQVSILNRNNVDLENATVIVEYPEGTVSAEDPTQTLPRESEDIGTVKSGEKFQKVYKAILFGEENAKKKINIVVEYRVEGSNAIFQKEKEHELVISSAPMSILVNGPDKASSGGEIEISVVATSNSEKPIKNAAVVVNYPFGFIFKEAEPAPTAGNNFWSLGDFAGDKEQKIVIRGVMEGQDSEERVFRVEAGVGDRTRIATLFTSFLHSVVISRPALSIDTAVSGKSGNTIVLSPGAVARVDLSWKNNLQNQISDLVATSKISTSGFSISKVTASSAFFRSEDQAVVWTKDRNKNLAFVNPGEQGTLTFSFQVPELVDLVSTSKYKNPNVKIISTIVGKDLAVSQSNDVPSGKDEVVVKIASPVSIAGAVTKKNGDIYTIKLTIKNPLNDLSGVKVTASLPSYVKWTGSFKPSQEVISHNAFGGEIAWNVGKVPAGVGYFSASREVSFDVELDSSLGGLAANPSFLNNIKISGEDDYTLTKVEFRLPSVNLGS